ncbi:MAG: hypothetical protein RR942_10075 [Romboutsia sp.]
MASKRKFKRDYIILEAKDMNFRYKERILPKAFAKVEINDEKSVIALYVENLKCVKEGYRVVAIKSDYDIVDLGNVTVSDQGKGEFILNLENSDIEIKGIAMLYERTVPLIGFKGSKIENYEEILFVSDDNYQEDEQEEEDEYEEYEEIEYIEVDEDDPDFNEYEEIEYIEIDDSDEYEDNSDDDSEEEYEVYPEVEEETEYIEEEREVSGNLPYEQKKIKVNSRQKIEKIEKIKSRNNNNDDSYEAYQETSYQYEPKSAGALLMPRQIKKGLKLFREVKPFVSDYIEDTRWWKIEINPSTLCGYTMPYLGYVNTLNYTMYSDAVMNSYKYRHYLFGVQYDEYNKRKNYIYAVPGNKSEQPDKGHTGFTTYQPCDSRNDKLGYWLCFIDSRTRRIVK